MINTINKVTKIINIFAYLCYTRDTLTKGGHMSNHHKAAGKAGGSKSSRRGITNLVTKQHNVLHGENALVRVSALPEGASPLETSTQNFTQNGYIVGHSETGHNHVLERVGTKTSKPDIELYTKDGITYMIVNESSEIVHKKSFDNHVTLPIEKGIWKITKKSEYDPFQKRIREVRD